MARTCSGQSGSCSGFFSKKNNRVARESPGHAEGREKLPFTTFFLFKQKTFGYLDSPNIVESFDNQIKIKIKSFNL